MTARGHVLEHVAHDARIVDHERGAICEPERPRDAKPLDERAFRIGDEPAMQIVLRDEVPVRFDGIFRNADERRARLVEVSRPLTELYGLDRSARRVVFGIRPQDDVLLAPIVGEVEMPFRRLTRHGDHQFPDFDVRAHGMTRRTWNILSPAPTVLG